MKRIATLLLVSAVAATSYAAITPGVDFTQLVNDNVFNTAKDYYDTGDNPYPSYSTGFSFTVSQATTVSLLGYFDAGRDGFADSHAVGLYDGSGTLLRTATVTSSDPLGDAAGGYWFRWHDMDQGAITLQPGTTYVVAGVTGAVDAYNFYYSAPTYDPYTGITYQPDIKDFTQNWATFGSPRYESSNVLKLPAYSDTGIYGMFGPNVAVPEPASLLSIGAGLCLLLLRQRQQDMQDSAQA